MVSLSENCNLTTDPDDIAVTINGIASALKLFKANDGNLYVKAASVTTQSETTYYSTVLAAVEAAGSTGGDITVLDGSTVNLSEYGYYYDAGTWKLGAASVIHDDEGTVTTNVCATLAAAISASATGDTVKLLLNNDETGIDTTGKDFVFDEDGKAFAGTLTGGGRITLAAAPSSTTWSSARFVDGGWTGTYVVGYAIPDGNWNVNNYGVVGSTVEIIRSWKGWYIAENWRPSLKVTGRVELSDGTTNSRIEIPKVTGTGVLVFSSSKNYTVVKLENWDGILTNVSASAYVYVTNIVSGSGRIVHTAGAPKAPESVGTGWTGVVELANLASNVNLTPFGGANSTVEISSNFTGYWSRNGSNRYETIPGKLLLSGNVEINNGASDGWSTDDKAPATWDEDNVVKISTLKVVGSLTLAYGGTYTGNYFSYRVDTLDATGSGAITVGNRSALRVNVVDVSALPSAGACVYPLAVATGAISDGAFYGSMGTRNGFVSVTVNGEASDCKLVYVSGANAGLYKAVALYGGNYYATFQDAINARGSGSGDITVLDASAPIPFGYKVSDGKLVRNRKIIFEFR